jgi:hypothetical protein
MNFESLCPVENRTNNSAQDHPESEPHRGCYRARSDDVRYVALPPVSEGERGNGSDVPVGPKICELVAGR